MKNKSSKYVMEDQLQILEKIQSVEAPSELYGKILGKIEDQKKDIVSPKWIFAAAAVIVILISLNVKVIQNTKDNSKSDFDTLFMMKSQNTFSYD
ncbi:hypothetical protein QX233_11890 [Chryseobacterium gambrini]|uniref:Uncharacterized protein n=1 Tax=Chryseobacterium gambrini TaxID=373672 RepID=A0AAJ1R6H1_9FLAO|nr:MULTISPECIES: hypothetical protein [Chryseobacterium]MDN4013167.1 hypothetical protein [Chryseobacterium gambrini]MDN4030144.1 hypothetical protein [Chryseobacterium gambrini]QWA40381.1 hypothetical protein KKI44_09345 [Chryseobacterium sp. ZHDP1]